MVLRTQVGSALHPSMNHEPDEEFHPWRCAALPDDSSFGWLVVGGWADLL